MVGEACTETGREGICWEDVSQVGGLPVVWEEQFCKLRAVCHLFRRQEKRQYLGQWRAALGNCGGSRGSRGAERSWEADMRLLEVGCSAVRMPQSAARSEVSAAVSQAPVCVQNCWLTDMQGESLGKTMDICR